MKLKNWSYGKYKYNYKHKVESRKTMSLTVQPDLQIILKTPKEASDEKIKLFLTKKWKWLEKQLQFFQKFQNKSVQKEYVSGESFLYLGRQYKLKIILGKESSVKLSKGVILLTTTEKVSDNRYNKYLITTWYKNKASEKLPERYKIILKNFNYKKPPVVVINSMQKRWGSYLATNKIVLNPKLIKAPTECIDYVITHELCHVKYQNHSTEFWEYLEFKFPNWKKTKDKLELTFS
jgi:predicted metal-dependent hydrolase